MFDNQMLPPHDLGRTVRDSPRDVLAAACRTPRTVARTNTEEGHPTASGLARLGLPVHVLPLTVDGQGFDWAADPLPVEDWRTGLALVLVTGRGLDVLELDADGPLGHEEARRILHARGVLVLGEVRTPGGGTHFYVLSSGLPSLLCGLSRWRIHAGQEGRYASAVYLPGTRRPEYGGLGYAWVVRPHLAACARILADGVLRAEQAEAVRSLAAILRPHSCACAA